MKKFILSLFAVFVVAILGFFVGRMTAPPDMPFASVVPAQEHVIPDTFPKPPDTTPYVAAVSNSDDDEASLIVETPVEQAAASGPFLLSGRAAAGSVIRASLTSGEDRKVVWSGESGIDVVNEAGFGRFELNVEPPAGDSGSYVLVVERFKAGSDVSSETVTRDVTVGIPDAVKVKVFFSKIDYGGLGDCSQVVAVSRVVSGSAPVYRATIEELLRGPTDAEKSEGFLSTIPQGVALKSVAADASGTVVADFSKAMGKGVAGSCLVTTIRSQVTETLKQFPEVRDVVIAVEGRFEDVLQP